MYVQRNFHGPTEHAKDDNSTDAKSPTPALALATGAAAVTASQAKMQTQSVLAASRSSVVQQQQQQSKAPKKQRGKYTCGKCGELGHNRTSCKNAATERPTEEKEKETEDSETVTVTDAAERRVRLENANGKPTSKEDASPSRQHSSPTKPSQRATTEVRKQQSRCGDLLWLRLRRRPR